MPIASTETLALFLGLYFAAAGIGLITDPRGYAGMMRRFQENDALAYLAAVAAFFLGAVLVSVHNVWSGPVEILVTLVGWAALAEGAAMLAARRWFLRLFAPLAESVRFMRAAGIATAAAGALLLLWGAL